MNSGIISKQHERNFSHVYKSHGTKINDKKYIFPSFVLFFFLVPKVLTSGKKTFSHFER
jgi:hypothetical protein